MMSALRGESSDGVWPGQVCLLGAAGVAAGVRQASTCSAASGGGARAASGGIDRHIG